MDHQSLDGLTRASISETRAAFVAALARGDSAAAATAYEVGARLLPPSAGLLRGRRAIEAFWRAGLDAGLLDIDLQALELATRDGLAWEIGCYALQMQPPDDVRIIDRGKYVLVHERQSDGSWLRTVEMFNPDAPFVCQGRRNSHEVPTAARGGPPDSAHESSTPKEDTL